MEEDSGGAESHVLKEDLPPEEAEFSDRLEEEAESHEDDDELHRDPDLLTELVHVVEIAEAKVCQDLQILSLLAGGDQDRQGSCITTF